MRRGAAFAVTCAAAALGLGCGSGDPERLSGAGPSKVAFSFGGRIHLMNSDGSGRVRLTGGRFGREDDGDAMPAWSPDASRLAFVRSIYHRRSGDGDLRIYLIDATGGPARRLPVAGDVLAPAWSPDGQRLALVRARDDESEIVVAGLDGGGQQVLYTERPGKEKVAYLNDPAWSPDGSQIAFTRVTLDERGYFNAELRVMGADGANQHVLASDASGAAWSPDGQRIAFASGRDHNGKTCYEECSYRTELYVMDSDGTNPVRLTRNRGNDLAPSWSPDGRWIAFASDRNHPQPGGTEIYSIGADGSCLTWLTNGSPPSGEPDWSSGPTTPGSCQPTRRKALVEVDIRPVRAARGERVFWLGEDYRGLLLGHVHVARAGRARHSYFFGYDDCARYRARACGSDLQLQEVSVCSRWGSSTLPVVDQAHYPGHVRAFAARGLLFVDIGQRDLAAVIGATHVRIFGHVHPGTFGALREFGKPAARLPAPALPRDLLRRLHRTEGAYAQSGSLGGAARALGIPAQQVRRRLELARAVRALPSVRAVDCHR